MTALEYALLAAVTIGVGMASFGLLGPALTTVFGHFQTALAQ